MTKDKCKECDKQSKSGYNYCRVCGFHLTKGLIQFTRSSTIYSQGEIYCDYCGKLKVDCRTEGCKRASAG